MSISSKLDAMYQEISTAQDLYDYMTIVRSEGRVLLGTISGEGRELHNSLAAFYEHVGVYGGSGALFLSASLAKDIAGLCYNAINAGHANSIRVERFYLPPNPPTIDSISTLPTPSDFAVSNVQYYLEGQIFVALTVVR